jgi:hypothetical protein
MYAPHMLRSLSHAVLISSESRLAGCSASTYKAYLQRARVLYVNLACCAAACLHHLLDSEPCEASVVVIAAFVAP